MNLKQFVTLFLLSQGEQQIAETLKHRLTPKRRQQLAAYAGELEEELASGDMDGAAHTLTLILGGIRL